MAEKQQLFSNTYMQRVLVAAEASGGGGKPSKDDNGTEPSASASSTFGGACASSGPQPVATRKAKGVKFATADAESSLHGF